MSSNNRTIHLERFFLHSNSIPFTRCSFEGSDFCMFASLLMECDERRGQEGIFWIVKQASKFLISPSTESETKPHKSLRGLFSWHILLQLCIWCNSDKHNNNTSEDDLSLVCWRVTKKHFYADEVSSRSLFMITFEWLMIMWQIFFRGAVERRHVGGTKTLFLMWRSSFSHHTL